MQTLVVYFEGCPHAEEARRRLVEVLGEDSLVEMRVSPTPAMPSASTCTGRRRS